MLGDGLFIADRLAEAEEAYLMAKRIAPQDLVTNFNLSFVYYRTMRYRAALDALAVALANDFGGAHRDRIVHQQQSIMLALSVQWNRDQVRMLQRAAAFE